MILLIDNFDSFTFNLAQICQTLGAPTLVLRNDDPEILHLIGNPRLRGVILSAGPGHPRSTGLCPRFLDLASPAMPVLGVCLGHQTLAHHSGATVGPAPRIMHGKTSDIGHDGTGIFEGIPSPMRVGRYHSLAVLEDHRADMPFDVTARAEHGEIMALAFRNRPWFGAQFHPESVLTPDGPKLLGNFLKLCGIQEA